MGVRVMRPVLTFAAFVLAAVWFFLALDAHAQSGPQTIPEQAPVGAAPALTP